MRWYIDAINARSGRAFASYREENLLNSESLDDAKVTFFLEPPTFDPVQVSRSVAFAALRFQFQEGLFDGEQEVPFNDLADVIEFVRRSYLRRGGGGGGDEGGGGEPPPEGPLSPEAPEWSAGGRGEGEIDPIPALREKVELFEKESASLERGSSKAFTFVDFHQAKSSRRSTMRLARGALRMAIEQIRTYSAAGDEQLNAQQRSNMQRLFNVISSAGIFEEFHINVNNEPRLREWLDEKFTQFGIPFVPGPSELSATELILLFLSTARDSTDDWFEARDLYFRRRRPWYYYDEKLGVPEEDPIDFLGRLKVSQQVARLYARQADEPVFLDQFLFSFLAAPQLCGPKTGLFGDEAVELALFASACIVLPTTLRRYPIPQPWRDRPFKTDNVLSGEAEKWLRQNLPRKLFSKAVEDLIVCRDQLAKVSRPLAE